ncbi:urea transport protein [Spathaspora passalidarum NRRL Y-27907]|uniref:Urea transport protein n=1 Tax=Spathaspora passalidarum (strain NRRL Y-27907 / 11-Y1) TaxID=619300 RepID=G3AUS4_SPAPN|nr:urea transport protein [Spathaspora passalidarum NRRL Y-27907]EGW30630.1 urea transport protein [Spathaspora passalidarum NRRL Y-27907]
MSDEASPVNLLPQGAGYGVLLGVGAVFAAGMILTTFLLKKYLNENSNNTETFSVADRNVGTFLSASAVYSSWSWADELLWSCTMVYNYGIQASYYYGAGLAVQIAVMSCIGIHAKKKAPKAHTSLEIVELRYGKAAHILYLFLGLTNNLISCSSMILAASGAISIIAGNLHIVASAMLIPFGVLLYTIVGGLKATFLTDFVHSLILLTILCYLNTSVLTSEKVGGLDSLYDMLVNFEATGARYIEGNYQGSMLTGKSSGALFFGLILTCGNFGLTVLDSSFWQKTFSASPRATVPAYLIAAFCIFANTWPLGAIIGSSSIVLEHTSAFPTYPRAMTQYEIDSGYVLPYVLKALLGNGAVGALLLVIYMAVTSTVSAQMISVSSILSFDIYKKYINPQARNKSMIRISHIGCVFFSFGSAGFSLMLHYVGVNMTWFGYFIPLLICPGVIPLIFTITWSKQSWLAAVVSPVIGMAAGLSVWVGTAKHYYGVVTIDALGGQFPALFGSLTALLLPGILSLVISLIRPSNFDWKQLQEADILVKDDEDSSSAIESLEKTESDVKVQENEFEVEISDIESSKVAKKDQLSEKQLDFWIKVSSGAAIFVLLITWVLWPMPLYRDWIFTRAYFKGYVTVGLMWLYGTLVVIGIMPIISGRHSTAKVLRGVYRDYIQRK